MYAFDLLWCDGEDLRYLPLIERKSRLRSVVPKRGERLLYCDHIEGDGEGLFRLACEHDLEGFVAKRKHSPYLPQEPSCWLKIRNRKYSQWAGREELFERERERNPDVGRGHVRGGVCRCRNAVSITDTDGSQCCTAPGANVSGEIRHVLLLDSFDHVVSTGSFLLPSVIVPVIGWDIEVSAS